MRFQFRSFVSVAVVLVASGSLAHAQSFNVDFGTRAGVPTSSYGGPANSPGFWNPIAGGTDDLVWSLNDVSGAPTGVTMETLFPLNPGSLNPRAETAGDAGMAALLDDFIFLNGDIQSEFVFRGLQDGQYDLTVAAIWVGHPDEPTSLTWLSNDFNDFLDDITGDAPFTGQFQLGVSHTTFRVPVVNGELHLYANGIFNLDTESFGNINGLQLTRVPSPGAASLALVCAGLLGARRRR